MKKDSPINFYKLVCVQCGKVWLEEKASAYCLDCHAPLDVHYDYDYIKSRLNTYALKNAPISATKYIDFYPIKDLKKIIT